MSLRELAKEIYRVERLATSHATSPQLGYSSTDSSVDIVDADGNVVGTVGRQDDGGVAVKPVDGPTPPPPSTPVVDWEWGIIHVRWDGAFTTEGVEADGSVFATSDLACIDVYASTSPTFEDTTDDGTGVLVATIYAPPEGGASTAVAGMQQSGEWYVRLVARSTAGKVSDPSETATVMVGLTGVSEGLWESWIKADDALVTADGKNTVHGYGGEQPPADAAKDGDLWFDDDHVPHKFDEYTGEWETVTDTRIKALQDAEASLRGELEVVKNSAKGDGSLVHYSPKRPDESKARTGDVWFDTSFNENGEPVNRVHVFDASVGRFVYVADERLATVEKAQESLKADLSTVKATADGKNQSFYQPTTPTGTPAKGDLWFDTSKDGKNRVSVWDGKSWVDASDQRVQDVQKTQESLSSDLAGVRKSVDGKTTTRWESSVPTSATPGGVAGDTWHQYTGGKHVGTWRWDGKAWVQQSLDPVMIPKLDIGTGTFGELDGARLKVGTVSADKVLIGSDRNMLPDGDLVRGGVGWPDGFTLDTEDKPSSCQASMATAPGSGNMNLSSMGAFPVDAGDTLVFDMWIKADKPGSVFYAEVRDQAGAHVSTKWVGDAAVGGYPVGRFTVPTEWVRVTAETVVPDGVTSASLRTFYFNHSAGSERGAQVKISGLRLYLKVGSTVIADGAITTEKIAAGAITAESGVVGSLDAGKLTTGFIDSARIQAGSIRADQVQVSTDDNWLSVVLLANGVTAPHQPLNGGTIETITRVDSYGPSFRVKRGSNISAVALRAPAGSSGTTLGGNFFPVQVGMRMMFKANLFRAGSYTDGVVPKVRTVAYHYKPDGSYLNQDVFKDWTSPGAFSGSNGAVYEHEWVVPQGAAWMQLYVQLDSDTGWVVFGDPVLKPMVSGTLIEPGAITTEKLAVGAITAESGVIGSLDAGKITVGEMDGARIKANTVQADKVLVKGSVGSTVIADGAITTDKIAAGAITANSGVIGSLDASKITVGKMDGKHIKANTIATEQLAAGAVKAGILDANAINGMVITGATVQTASSHPKSLMDTAGFHVTDSDGMDQITLGQAGGDLLSISDDEGTPVATVSNLGEISGAALNIDTDPVFNGLPLVGQSQEVLAPTSAVELTSWFDALPRGVIAHGREDGQSGWEIKSGGGEMALLEVQADLKANRMYKITVSPVVLQTVDGGWCDLFVKYDWKGNRPTFDSTMMRKISSTPWTKNGLVSLGGAFLYSPGSDEDTRFLLTVKSGNRTRMHDSGQGISEMIIEDVGPFVDNVGVKRTDNDSEVAEAPPKPKPKPPPPPPQKKNYTKKYWANGGRTFYTKGGWRNQNRDKCYQGTMPGMGGVQSIATFPSMTGDLSGATITAMTAYVYMEHFYYGSGGVVKLTGHNRLSSDITKMPDGWKLLKTSNRIGRNSGVQIPIPREYWNDFKTGKLKGIGLGDSSPSTSEYGYGPWKRMWIEVKYRK